MIDWGAFVLAFAFAAITYIGILMYEGYKEAVERNDE